MDNLILQCENEDVDYNIPEKITDSNGKNIYAYVTYVFLNDKNIVGALVLAQSLINCGSNVDRVVLVSHDISQTAISLLRKYYNQVIPISYVNITTLTVDDMKNKYVNIMFSKLFCLNLTQYKKIILVSPDTVILKHPDHVFSLNTPAGILQSEINTIEKYINCDKLIHGSIIDKKVTSDVLNNNNLGINDDYLLLTPELGLFDDILLEISSGKYQDILGDLSYPLQQFLTHKYSGKWTQINPRFLGNNGEPNWKVLFSTTVNINMITNIKDYIDLDIYILFTDIYRQILNTYPEFIDIDILKDINKTTQMFLINKKKSTEQIGRVKVNYLAENYDQYYSMYNIKNIYKNMAVHKSQLSYYHLDRFNTNNNINPQPMFPDIEELDYVAPIVKLAEYFGEDNYYKQILSFLSFTTKKSLYKYNYLTPEVRDLVMLEYTKCRPNMYIIGLLPNAKHDLKELEEVITYLESKGSVVYIKTLSLNKNALKNLLFWWHSDNFQSRLYLINNLFNNINILEQNNPVTLIFFDDVKNIGISKNINNKEEIINNISKMLKIKDTTTILINNYFYETVEFAQLVLNNNSLQMLNYQNVDKISTSYFSISNLQLQTFRNAIYSNFSLLELNRIIILDDVSLYSLGIRNFNNIDALFISNDKDNTEYEKYLESVIYDNFSNKDTKIEFINLVKENSKFFNKNYSQKIKELLDELDINDLTELTTNPANYCYFQGVKLFNITSVIVKCLLEFKNINLLDIVMLNILTPELTKLFMNYNASKNIITFNKTYNKNNKIIIDDDFKNKINKYTKYFIKGDIRLVN